MGLLGRILNNLVRTKAEHRGARLEAQGQLEEAYEAYLTAGLLPDAARVILARAESEPDPNKRIALLHLAASRAPDASVPAKEARRRAALLRLDLARGSTTLALTSELLDLAHDLESLGLMQQAGEAFGLAGDTENQTRVLVACGAIADLENVFESERRSRAEKRQREQAWKEIRDLDAIGRRVLCLQRCEAWLVDTPLDESVAAFARTVREKLVRHGSIPLVLNGERVEVVVEHPLILGRSDASVVLPSAALSRQHLCVHRSKDQILVEDMRSRNGTWLAGARVDGALPVGQGIDLKLGSQVPCRLEPRPEGGVRMTLPGRLIIAPLGPLHVDGFEVRAGNSGVTQLHSHGPAPILNGLTADNTVDLAYGDKIQRDREGPFIIEVIAS